jgi:uncharacterized protein (TIGR02147 family)
MSVIGSKNYREIIRLAIERSQWNAKKLSEHLGVSTAFMSQVLAEQKNLTPDQAHLTSEYFGFTQLERQYFLKVVEWERAGHYRYKEHLNKELKQIEAESKVVAKRIQFQKVLKNEDKAIFYSDWYYSAVRMYCDIQPRTFEELVQLIGVSKIELGQAVEFLIEKGLLVEADGKYRIGTMSTHLEADSPFVLLHHANWRKKALEYVRRDSPTKIHYSSPMTLSADDAEKIQKILLEAIQNVGRIVDPSPSEQVMCLNIDWFKLGS